MKSKTELAEEWYNKNKYFSDFPKDRQSFIAGYGLAIEHYKENVEGVPLTQDEVIESFCLGFLCREKEVNKIILDNLNKLRSDLSYEQKVKLTKVISKDKIEALKLKIELLIEIQNKLKQKIPYNHKL